MDGASEVRARRCRSPGSCIIVFINCHRRDHHRRGAAGNGASATPLCIPIPMLTIGDGLISQIPALVISTAAGLLVTKAGVSGSADKAVFEASCRTLPAGARHDRPVSMHGAGAVRRVDPDACRFSPGMLLSVLTGAFRVLPGRRSNADNRSHQVQAEAAEGDAPDIAEADAQAAAKAEEPIDKPHWRSIPS